MQQPIEEIKNTIKPGCFVRMSYLSRYKNQVFEVAAVNLGRDNERFLCLNPDAFGTNNHGFDVDEQYKDRVKFNLPIEYAQSIIGSLADLNKDHNDVCPCNTCKRCR